MTWKPSLRASVDLRGLPLDPEQGYLLSLLDGSMDVDTLAAVMNLDAPRVAGMLDRLVDLGAVEGEHRPTAAPPAPAGGPEEAAEPDPEPADPEDLEAAARNATHRQLFETVLRAQTVDARCALARNAEEPELSALCFDPAPEVVRALLENPRLGGIHARLVAAHHRTVAGLEALGGRLAFTNDAGVRRALLRNPLLPQALYRRLWSPRRLLEQYQVVTSRECPEQVRAMARDLLRASFNQRTGEERVELILTTEARCLASLVGLTLDGHTTALLCRRTYVSTLMIQNFARWSAAPPQLIAHLRRQDLVRRNAPLRQLLERHPNAG